MAVGQGRDDVGDAREFSTVTWTEPGGPIWAPNLYQPGLLWDAASLVCVSPDKLRLDLYIYPQRLGFNYKLYP